MSGARPDLLKPSLAHDAAARPPYSNTAVILAAFFGGPAGALAMFAWNAVRLNRLGRDAAFLVGGFVAYAAWLLWPQGDAALRASSFGRSGAALAVRVLALAIFVVALVRHRREQRSADLFGLARPSPWLPTIGCIVAGNAVDIALRVAVA